MNNLNRRTLLASLLALPLAWLPKRVEAKPKLPPLKWTSVKTDNGDGTFIFSRVANRPPAPILNDICPTYDDVSRWTRQVFQYAIYAGYERPMFRCGYEANYETGKLHWKFGLCDEGLSAWDYQIGRERKAVGQGDTIHAAFADMVSELQERKIVTAKLRLHGNKDGRYVDREWWDRYSQYQHSGNGKLEPDALPLSFAGRLHEGITPAAMVAVRPSKQLEATVQTRGGFFARVYPCTFKHDA